MMKKILITGANSYIGTSFEKYLSNRVDFQVDTLDVKDPSWSSHSFDGYDAVFHVAAIVHRKETKENEALYYQVNRDLTLEIAKKAKAERVSQFVFMSSMSVYGLDCSDTLIGLNTETNPKTYYGKSKLQAEEQLLKLQSDDFTVSIMRPPMVYGDDAPGNLTKLLKAVRKVHIFPTIKNERSSITVEKLCEELKVIIEECKAGIFLPQNEEYLCTYKIVKASMDRERVKVIYTSLFNPVIRFLIGKISFVTKVFGDLKYER